MTKATGSSELVERLREGVQALYHEPGQSTPIYAIVPANQTMRKAANRIADLEARLARAEASAPRPDNALADELAKHWLSDVGCLHDDSPTGGSNKPSCSCGWTGERVATVGDAARLWARHALAAIRSTPPEADLRAENEDTISVSGLLDWIEQTWPEGSGSDFNKGVVRGFEIIRAQLQEGYIQRYCAALSTLTPSPAVDLLREAAALVAKLDECQPYIDSAFFQMANHGMPHTGPQYGEELEALRAALQENDRG